MCNFNSYYLASDFGSDSQVWNTEYPETVAEGRITFTPLDFFKEEPVHDLDIYYVGTNRYVRIAFTNFILCSTAKPSDS